MPQDITEQLTLEATTASSDGSLLVEFITPGWGSSGYYSPEVVEAAAPLFAVGTHLYLDHPTEEEDHARPVRSVKDLAAVITEAGTWSSGGIRGKVKPFGPYRDLLLDEDFAKNIGLSIRASASDIVIGEAEGRKGPIIEGLVNLKSVDFVTRAGRGGRVLQVLESAGTGVQEARNIGQWVESRIHRDFTVMADDMAGDGRLTREERIGLSSAIGDALVAFVGSLEANQPQLYTRDLWADPVDTVAEALALMNVVEATADERRTQLSDAVRSAYAGEGRYAWVQDFDESTVWFQASADNERGRYWEQAYTVADNDLAVTLTGERTEVRQVTRYLPITTPIVPVTRPGSTTTTESQEDTMPNIEEAELSQLREASGRVPTLEAERDTAVQERDTARSDLAIERRTNRARALIAEAEASFTPLEQRGLLADLPVGEDGTLDEAAFTTTVTEAAAASAAARGAGSVRGFGGGARGDQDELSEAELDNKVAGAFGRTVKEA